MPRWLLELLQPSVKCERLGHKHKHHRQTVLIWPSEHPEPMRGDSITEIYTECRRCGHVPIVDPVCTDRRQIHLGGLDAKAMMALTRDGRLEIG